MGTLVLIRHGQSQWNLENRFTGFTDVPLTERGREDCKLTAKVLQKYKFDIGFTSVLERAIMTLDIILQEIGQTGVPVVQDKALNERSYGDLQGLNKAETVEKYGEAQVKLWRRDYDTRPPNGESLVDCYERVVPFLTGRILPEVAKGKTVIVAAHGNSLRPIFQFLDHLDKDTTAHMEIGLCTPYVYTFEGEKMTEKNILDVPGIVTKGWSLTEAKVSEGRV